MPRGKPGVTTITSSSNAKIRLVRALQQRKERDSSRLFVAEGRFIIGEALTARAEIEFICYAPGLLKGRFSHELVEQARAAGVSLVETSAQILAQVSEKEHPQGLLAVVRQQRVRLDDLSPANFPWGVALVSPQDPGNLGAILRTIDAVGASGLVLLEGGVDAYHPTAVRASMGALFWHPVVSASFGEWADWTRQHGYAAIGTSAHAATDYREVGHYRLPLMLLMGSEREGLTPDQTANCALMLRLPMRGRVTSLNLAVATGVMLYAVAERLEDSPRKQPQSG
jgi:TrmH family RNA methyltransferase